MVWLIFTIHPFRRMTTRHPDLTPNLYSRKAYVAVAPERRRGVATVEKTAMGKIGERMVFPGEGSFAQGTEVIA
jgi:hypothetical protein